MGRPVVHFEIGCRDQAKTGEFFSKLFGWQIQTAGPAHNIVVLNAGAAIYVGGLAKTHKEGVERARRAIASGDARRKLDDFVAFSRKLKGN